MTLNNSGLPWTSNEEDRARALFAAGADDATFLAEIGRTKAAAKTRLNAAQRRERTRESRKDPNSRRPGAPISVPAAIIEEAARRRSAERSITAEVFGDPPPGYSALDRRNAGASA